MADAEAVIRLDADVTAYIQKMVRAQKATEDAGKKGANGIEKAMDAIQKSAAKLGTAVGTFTAINAVLDRIDKTHADLASRNRESGQSALEMSRAVNNAGGNVEYSRRWLETSKGTTTTTAQRMQLMSSIAQIQEQRRLAQHPELSAGEIAQAQRAFSLGGEAVFGQGGSDITSILGSSSYSGHNFELLASRLLAKRMGGTAAAGYKPGNLADLIRKNLGQQTPGALGEIAIRGAEGYFEDIDRDAALDKGQAERVRQTVERARRTQSPYASAALDLLQSTPFIGRGVEFGANAGDRSTGAEQLKSSIDDLNRTIKGVSEKHGAASSKKQLPNLGARDEQIYQPLFMYQMSMGVP